jgi:hypothetical protein
MSEALTTPFVMHGARDAIASGLTHVEQQVKSIEQAVAENPGLAFDLAKTLVESVCRAVLGERNIGYSEDDDLPKLFKTASQHLPFLPPTASGEAEVRDSLKRTLGGLSTAIQGICELRNQCGFASHGSGAPRPPMESVQALLVAEAADTLSVSLSHPPAGQNSHAIAPPLYDDNQEFNDSVDETHGIVRVFDEEFMPSRVLFELAPEPYRVYLAEFKTNEEVVAEEAAEGVQSGAES